LRTRKRAVADAYPLDAGWTEGRADQRAAHALERGVLEDLLGNGGVGKLERLVKARRHIAAGGREGVQEELAGKPACQRAPGMSAHAVGEHGRQHGGAFPLCETDLG